MDDRETERVGIDGGDRRRGIKGAEKWK